MFDAQPEYSLFAASERSPVGASKRKAIKAAGGAEYEALLVSERAARAKFRKKHPERFRELRQKHKKKTFKTELVRRAKVRGRKRGLDATITVADLHWPSHCPVLGLALSYPNLYGERGLQHMQPNWPSLDRYEPAKGYVTGNVFVISCRANTLKSNATYEEILKVAKYLARRPRHV